MSLVEQVLETLLGPAAACIMGGSLLSRVDPHRQTVRSSWLGVLRKGSRS